jgi:hypothetical protein
MVRPIQNQGVPFNPVPIDNADQYRMTLEALEDVEIQLAAVDETLCNLPMVVRDVMRRALSDNADLLREELRAYDAARALDPHSSPHASAILTQQEAHGSPSPVPMTSQATSSDDELTGADDGRSTANKP